MARLDNPLMYCFVTVCCLSSILLIAIPILMNNMKNKVLLV